jgi:UDP-glucose 4-epimerase
MKKILVTGSHGFIGQNLIKALDSKEFEIFSLDKVDIKRHKKVKKHFNIDLSEKFDFAIFNDVEFDYIVHLAAQTSVPKSIENPILDASTNILGTLQILKIAINTKCKKFIYGQSGGAIYSTKGNISANELDKIDPESPYGISKFTAELYVENLCNRYGVKWLSLAFSNIYGDVLENRKGVIFEFAKSLINNSNCYLYGRDISRDFLYVEDAVSALISGIKLVENKRINISAGYPTKVSDVFNLVVSEIGGDYRLLNIVANRPGEIISSSLNNSLAKSELNWTPRISIEDGIKLALQNVSQLRKENT